ncbi:MAG: FtsW/RodA/SpoVE family cell cycle protein, partial [Marinomonas sp.]
MSNVKPFRPNLPSEIGSFHPQLRREWHDELRIWWREIDKVLLLLIGLLMAMGTAAVAAASPATAARLSTAEVQLGDFYFLKAHVIWQALGIAVMLGASMLSRDNARRLGIVLAAGMLALLFLVPLIGVEVNGARRWIRLGMQFQPSEFLKPGFAI